MDRYEVDTMSAVKKIKTELEDMLVGEINDKVSDYADEKCSELYQKIQKNSDEILTFLRMDDLLMNFENYMNKVLEFISITNEAMNYFSKSSRFTREVINIVHPMLNDKIKEINELMVTAYFNNNQRISHNIMFQKEIIYKNITGMLNEMTLDTCRTYRDLICDTVKATAESIKNKPSEIEDYLKNHESEQELIKNNQAKLNRIKKIVSSREMDKLLISYGYEPVRQRGTSHVIYSNNVYLIPVPKHGKNINKNLAYTIQKEIRQKNKKIS